jgi:hypothetical protein
MQLTYYYAIHGCIPVPFYLYSNTGIVIWLMQVTKSGLRMVKSQLDTYKIYCFKFIDVIQRYTIFTKPGQEAGTTLKWVYCAIIIFICWSKTTKQMNNGMISLAHEKTRLYIWAVTTAVFCITNCDHTLHLN